MYHNYFGLKEQAFSIAVNPRYLYMSHQHKEALAHLLYSVQGGGFVLLSGEVGTGKTTIIRCLLEQQPENTEIAIILNPMANVQEIFSTICDELAIEHDKSDLSLKKLTDAVHEHLLANHARGYNTVLLIDEAQLLSPEALEQIRLLTNLETNTQKLLQIILVGQPEINELLAQPRLRQLSQRITARYHLKPLSLEETEAYINHRLQVAGMQEDRNPFTPRVVKRIHSFTGGIPRRINILCERTLIGAYGHNKQQIDNKIFNLARSEVVGKVDGFHNHPLWVRWRGVVIPGLFVLTGGVFVFLLYSFLGPANLAPPPMSPSKQAENSKPPPTPEPIADTTVAAAEPAVVKPSQKSSFFIGDQITAQGLLFSFLEIPVSNETYPCWALAEQQIQCDRIELSTWKDIKMLNRPVVLTLVTPEKFNTYTVLVGFESDNAILVNEDSILEKVALETLGPMWSGSAFYVWNTPGGYTEPILVGQKSPVVSWVAKQFALLDQQTSPLTGNLYNRALRERVKIFQDTNELDSDGIIGRQTILKLNEIIGIDKTLLTEM